MNSSILHLSTAHGSKYLQQLGKHFGHKVPVTFTASKGEVTLPFGTCNMVADTTSLTITVSGQPKNLGQLEGFIGDHLERFAFRENPTLTWQRAA